MSTVDSQLLVTASAVTEDIYRKIIKPDASQKMLLFLARIFTLLAALIAFFLGLRAEWLVLRLYNPTEIVHLLKNAGLKFYKIFSNFDSKPFTSDSRRMIIIAKK